MISPTLEKALNDHLNEEMFSFYLYLSMSAYLETQNMKGMAHWMRTQAEEEYGHARKFYEFLNDRGGRVILGALSQPQAEWASPLAAFEAALAHERHITQRIGALVDAARTENDHATFAFLQWFVNEQVEEEATLEPIIKQMQDTQASKGALYYLDRQLGKRGKE
ncbi:MAG: ferritin [Acidobacteriota bacterium]|jgi:ferritin